MYKFLFLLSALASPSLAVSGPSDCVPIERLEEVGNYDNAGDADYELDYVYVMGTMPSDVSRT